MKKLMPAIIAVIFAGTAFAQTGAPPKLEGAEGVVTSISGSTISLAETGGKVEAIPLRPDWSASVAKSISVEEIKPGSYIGTTNHAKPDGTGQSTEVHVMPAGGPGLDFLMDSAAQTTMTNGTVATVVKSDGGQVLEVNYGSGVRRVTVPPGTPVVLISPASRDLVKKGVKVRVATFAPPNGGPPRQIVTIQ